jgi:hypothetical protein
VTTPETNGPGEPARELSVSTAPPSAPRRWWSAVPHHLGRARTSTVVLALLFVGLYTLYLYVRPPDVPTAPATDGTTVQTPARSDTPLIPTGTAEPTTTAPATTTPPSPTSAVPAPSTPGEATPSAGTTARAPTTAGEEPTTTRAPIPAVPTTGVAPGT